LLELCLNEKIFKNKNIKIKKIVNTLIIFNHKFFIFHAFILFFFVKEKSALYLKRALFDKISSTRNSLSLL